MLLHKHRHTYTFLKCAQITVYIYSICMYYAKWAWNVCRYKIMRRPLCCATTSQKNYFWLNLYTCACAFNSKDSGNLNGVEVKKKNRWHYASAHPSLTLFLSEPHTYTHIWDGYTLINLILFRVTFFVCVCVVDLGVPRNVLHALYLILPSGYRAQCSCFLHLYTNRNRYTHTHTNIMCQRKSLSPTVQRCAQPLFSQPCAQWSWSDFSI